MRVERKGRKPRSVLFFVIACIGLWAIPVAIAGGAWAVGAGLESEAVSAPRIDYVTVGERMDAEVREVIYMGDILRVVLKVAGTDNFVMKLRNTLGQTKLSPGQTIKVGWHPQDARALDP